MLGFLVVAAIGVALVFLLRSMNKQFKKIGPKPGTSELGEAGEPGGAWPGRSWRGRSWPSRERARTGMPGPRGGAESGAEHVAGGARPTADVKSTGD